MLVRNQLRYFIPRNKKTSLLRLAKPDKAPAAIGAIAFLANGIAIGNNQLPKLTNDPHKLPPCLIAFLICVFDILISEPTPWLIAFLNSLI